MATCLVTGGAGFPRSDLTDELTGRGHRVICVDNPDTGSVRNVEHLRGDNFEFKQVDIIDPFFDDGPVESVYHPASSASPIDYLRLPLHTLQVGPYRTHRALGLAKKHRAGFLIVSTSEVPQVHPQPETHWGHVNPIGPRGVYDEAKRYAEALTTAYHRYQGVDTAIMRIFDTYGPRMRAQDGRAITTFMRQALQDKPITVFGDGSQTRSFDFATNLIRGVIALAESGVDETGNIDNRNQFTLLELAGQVVAVTGSKSENRVRSTPDRRPQNPPPRHHARPATPRLGPPSRTPRRPQEDPLDRRCGTTSSVADARFCCMFRMAISLGPPASGAVSRLPAIPVRLVLLCLTP